MTKEGENIIKGMLKRQGYCIKPDTLTCVHDESERIERCPIYNICKSLKTKENNWVSKIDGSINIVE